MEPRKDRNLEMLAAVARGLGPLKDRVVFIGGSTIGLYLTNPGAAVPRPTDDVDCVVEAMSRAKFHDLEAELRQIGFQHMVGPGQPICRWRFGGIIVDIMPADSKILGFANRWYRAGMASAATAKLPDDQEVAIFALPYLIASKIEALMDRSHGDYIGSKDLEDIVTIAEGCADFKDRIETAQKDVRGFIADNFKALLAEKGFPEALLGHLGGSTSTPQRFARVQAILVGISRLV